MNLTNLFSDFLRQGFSIFLQAEAWDGDVAVCTFGAVLDTLVYFCDIQVQDAGYLIGNSNSEGIQRDALWLSARHLW